MCVMTHSYVTHMNEPCHTYEWAMSHYERVKSHITHILLPHALTRVSHSCHRYASFISVTWMSEKSHSYVWHEWLIHMCDLTQEVGYPRTCVNESCHTYKYVVSHVWLIRVTLMNDSCHTSKRVMSHVWMSLVTLMNDSCHTYECVISHVWLSHVTLMNDSCHTCKYAMSHVWMSHGTHEWVKSHVWMSHVTPSRDSLIRVTWLTMRRDTRALACLVVHARVTAFCGSLFIWIGLFCRFIFIFVGLFLRSIFVFICERLSSRTRAGHCIWWISFNMNRSLLQVCFYICRTLLQVCFRIFGSLLQLCFNICGSLLQVCFHIHVWGTDCLVVLARVTAFCGSFSIWISFFCRSNLIFVGSLLHVWFHIHVWETV